MNLTPEKRKDLDFLSQTINWVYWPYCPVKRTVNNELLLGACFDEPNGKRTVYLANLFSIGEMSKEDFKNLQKFHYDSSYDMIADGWEVD